MKEPWSRSVGYLGPIYLWPYCDCEDVVVIVDCVIGQDFLKLSGWKGLGSIYMLGRDWDGLGGSWKRHTAGRH